MKRIVLLLLLLAVCGAAAGADDPAAARGFSPEKVYQFGSIDSVNLFNGNVIITIPVGQTYNVSPQLSYGLTLSYNSNVWDMLLVSYGLADCGPDGYVSEPHVMSNAGVGWSVGFGRLFPPGHIANTTDRGYWVYESPDGAVHAFDGGDGTTLATTDSSHLRMRLSPLNDQCAINRPGAVVEFPDGMKQYYAAAGRFLFDEWPLAQISDRFCNVVNVTWSGDGLVQTLTDSFGRHTVITYEEWDGNAIYHKVVKTIDVPAFNDSSARYTFNYVPGARLAREYRNSGVCDSIYIEHVPILQELILPDLSKYEPVHETFTVPNGKTTWSPSIDSLKLPTGGTIEYTYTTYPAPGPTCGPGFQGTRGVHTRTYVDRSGKREQWIYEPAMTDPVVVEAGPPYCHLDPAAPSEAFLYQLPVEQRTTTLTTPALDKEIHYFSVWQGWDLTDSRVHDPSPHGFRVEEYGLGLTHIQEGIGAKSLSSEYFDCNAAGACDDVADRSQYVEYDLHGSAAPFFFDVLPKATRTVFNKDVVDHVARYVETSSDDYDGYGHYRTVTTSGNFGLDGALVSRTVRTNFNGVDAEVGDPEHNANLKPAAVWSLVNGEARRFSSAEPWILNTFTSVTSTDTNGLVSKEFYFFDRNTGFLKRHRTRKGAPNAAGRYTDSGPSSGDLIVEYEPSSATPTSAAGHVQSEIHYGGDTTPLTDITTPLASVDLSGASGKRFDRTWQYGSLATARFAGTPYPTANLTNDKNTGYPEESRDPAERVTKYEYDSLGRITKLTLPDDTTSSYSYPPATSLQPARAEAVTKAAGSEAKLTHQLYEFDGFGRVVKEKSLTASGAYNLREITWNALNWKLSVSETVADGTSAANLTTYEYDGFGRPVTITPPDQNDSVDHKVTITYTGVSAIERTQSVGQSFNADGTVKESPARTVEEYDPFGLLVRATQYTGTGASTSGTYTYDGAGRLTDVSVSATGEQPQARAFRYDNRGFLQVERHPEKAETRYSAYDTFGKFGRRVEGTDGGKFDLKFTYDGFNRLVDVSESSGGQNMLKHFTFDVLPDGDAEGPYAMPGALLKSERRNDQEEIGGDRTVSTYFQYDDLGQVSQKRTIIRNGPSFTQKYTYDPLGALATLEYPTCSGCTQSGPYRKLELGHDHAFLTSVKQRTALNGPLSPLASLEYWPNGMINKVSHVNGVVDTIDLDTASNMARPASITFTGASDGCSSVTITQPPMEQLIAPNTSAVFTVVASGPSGATLQYTWFRGPHDNTAVQVGTGPSYTTPALLQSAQYWVRVSLGTCVVDSTPVNARVCVKPAIVEQPQSAEGLAPEAGQSVTLSASCTAIGENLIYTWYEGTPAAPGPQAGTGPTLVKTYQSTDPVGTTSYFCRVQDLTTTPRECRGTVDSDVITFKTGVDVVLDPMSQSVPAGTGAIIRAHFARANPQTRYEWRAGNTYDLSKPVIGSDSVLTVPNSEYQTLNEDASFWVAIYHDGTVYNSKFATVGVTCSGLTGFTQMQPGSGFLRNGERPVLTAQGRGKGVSYRWYRREGDNTTRDFVAIGPSIVPPVAVSPTRFSVDLDDQCGNHGTLPEQAVYICIPDVAPLPELVYLQAGGSISLTLQVSPAYSGQAIGYQWFRGDDGSMLSPIASTQTATLTLPVGSVAATYFAAVTTACGSQQIKTRSSIVELRPCSSPVIDAYTPSASLTKGQSATLIVNATGDELTYQWYQGTSPDKTNKLTGETGSQLTITPLDNTSYWCAVTSRAICTTNTPTIPVYVCAAPVITQQPQGRSIFASATATLTVAATESTSTPLQYAWLEQTSPTAWQVVNGATSPSFTTPPLTASKTYKASIIAGSCAVDSNPATLTVCSYAEVIPVSKDRNISSGEAVTLSVNDLSPAYDKNVQWFEGASGVRTTPLTAPALNRTLVIAPAVTTQYWAEVERQGCVSRTSTITLTVCIPTITTNPVGSTVASGTPVTLTVGAGGTTSVTYRWYKGASGDTSQPVVNATSASMTITPTATAAYWARVTGTCGVSADSSAATITVCSPPAITSISGPVINIRLGNPALLSVNASGNNLTYQWYSGASGGGSPISGATARDYSVSPAATTQYWVRVYSEGLCYANSTTVTVDVCTNPAISTQPQSQTIRGGQTAAISVSTAVSGVTYQWYQGTSGSIAAPVSGATASSYTTPVLNADTSYWVRLTRGACTTDSATAVITVCKITASVANAQAASGQGVYLTAGVSNSRVTQPTYTWYRGNSGNTAVPIGSGVGMYQIQVTQTAATNYWVRVSDGTCSIDSNTATVSVCIPTIVTNPASPLINSGQSATLSVDATGSPLTYQWYTGASGNTAAPIAGATGTSITVSPAVTTMYWVRVSGCGTADSTTATVTVCTPPSITSGPTASGSGFAGNTATLSISVNATNPTYQWYRGLSGDTSTPLFSNDASVSFTATDSQYYWVRVTACNVSVNSDHVLYSVLPAINTQPASQAIPSGTAATIGVTASGTYPAYQWFKGASGDTTQQVAGATSAQFTTPPLSANTSYWVRVWSGNRYVNSNTANITMCSGPSITGWTSSGNTLTVTVGQSFVGNVSYAWYSGPVGNTLSSTSLGEGPWYYRTFYPAAPTDYWVRVWKSDHSCYRDTPFSIHLNP